MYGYINKISYLYMYHLNNSIMKAEWSLDEAMRMIAEFNRISSFKEAAERKRILFEKINSVSEFQIRIFYRNSVKYDGRPIYENIRIEGIENSLKLKEVYRGMAFTLKIQKIELWAGKNLIFTNNFSYRIDR